MVTNEEAVETARTRLEALRRGEMDGNVSGTRQAEFTFVVNDNVVYHDLSQCRNKDARRMLAEWVQMSRDVDTESVMLQRLRDNYATALAHERQNLAPTIMQLEATYYSKTKQLQEFAKVIREAEQSAK